MKQIKAPFDGVVTARNVNIGDLLNAGGTSGRALFQVADIHRMRIFVNVPQAFLGDLKPGVKATLHLPGQQETFEAELSSTSNALEENSRTALIELQADNPDGKLWPGAFTEVQFHIPVRPQHVAHSVHGADFRRPWHARGRRRRQQQGRAKTRATGPRSRQPRRDSIRSVLNRSADRQSAGIDRSGRYGPYRGADAKKPTVAAAE